ncbi:hypothetical protein FKW77_009989 [Venturia effusa]|uniref:Rhodopsin domain-containing protein n=1 Tax=Venturia effusa TaxID=50376 RepID=A0A517LA35_9PEZI|nr:hypothetical protein FKW77_009989 [Venturia effusa]
MFGIITLFFAIFQCGFFSHISVFVIRIVSNQCASEALGLGINYTYASLATISDWTCILVPIFVLKESAMPLKRKLVVGGLMIFASLGSIASIVRLLHLHTITVPTGEFFVNVSKLSIWSTIEPGVGITVASLATLRPLLSKLVKRTYRSTATSPTVAAQTASGGNTLARGPSMKTYTRGGSVGMSSDSTVVASSPVHPKEGEISGFDRWTSKEEKVEDIEAEMRAYGMSNISTHTTLDEDYFNRYSTEIRRSRETERRVHWFESQRAERHPRARDSREHMLRSTSLSQPVSLDLSPVRQRIDENGEECTDEFTLDGQGLPGAPLRNGKADGNEAADA